MNKNYPEIKELCKALEKWAERPMRGPSDFDFLADAIWRHSKQQLSTSTLKRIWGYVDGTEKVRRSTLDILSRCAGYADWDMFVQSLPATSACSSDYILGDTLRSADLTVGDLLQLSWRPNRHLAVRYLGNMTYEVVKSENSKLHAGDTFSCTHFTVGQPLFIDHLQHDEAKPLAYVAGKNGGLTEVKKV